MDNFKITVETPNGERMEKEVSAETYMNVEKAMRGESDNGRHLDMLAEMLKGSQIKPVIYNIKEKPKQYSIEDVIRIYHESGFVLTETNKKELRTKFCY